MNSTEQNRILNIRLFLIVIGIYLVGLSLVLIIWGYQESFLVLNGHQTPWLDWPMFIITHLGDSMILASLLSLILVRKQPHTVLTMIVIVIITGLLGQVLKVTLFDGWDRPLKIFNESEIVHTMDNYRLFHNSFPSGHSITAMSAFTALIWCLNPRASYQILAALIAILITYSRIYLGVHFPGDVLAGSLTGILITLMIIPFIHSRLKRINYSQTFRITMTIVAVLLLVAGTWFLRIYFPLI